MSDKQTTGWLLKACPFCGAMPEPHAVQQNNPPRVQWFAVECHNCGAIGPDADTSDGARLEWNRREILGMEHQE